MNAMMFLQRHELRRLGFYFATEETYTPEGVLQLPAWSQPLVVHPVDASSTDAHDQGPQNLLRDDNQFWSSTGSDSQDSNEWLQLRCEGLCCVQAVQIQGFRANFQPGGPVYPPKQVSVDAGTTENRLEEICPPHKMAVTDAMQTFQVSGVAGPCCTIRINLHGKAQQQHMDRRWYIALRQVKVLGRRLDPAEIRRLQLQAPPRQQADW